MNRPEHRLLLDSASICSGQERRDRILACLAEGVDWEYLLQSAARHMMTSMLYRQLNTFCRDAVPSGIMDRLHEHYNKTSLSSLLNTAELIRILDLFRKHGIRAIPFKGPALAHALYGEPELREFMDLDILVCKPDVFRALRLLSDLNYGPVPGFSPYIQARILKNDFHYRVKKPGGRSIVEIHWNLVPGYFGFEMPGDIWREPPETISIQGHRIPHLTSGDQLAALSLHGYKHMWQILAWIADIARFLERHPGLNWDGVTEPSAHSDLRRIIFVALLLARDFLGGPLPEKMYQRIRCDDKSAGVAETVQRTFFQPETAWRALRMKRLQFSLISGIAGRSRAIVFFCFRPLPVDFKILLPRFLYPLYWVLRPAGLLFRYLRRLASRS